jgi:hypothetical protein
LALSFAVSASRHGISHARAAYVVEHCPLPLYLDDSTEFDDVIFFIGFDQRGIPLEVAAIERSEVDFVVIHAMPLRARFLPEFERVMRWHER